VRERRRGDGAREGEREGDWEPEQLDERDERGSGVSWPSARSLSKLRTVSESTSSGSSMSESVRPTSSGGVGSRRAGWSSSDAVDSSAATARVRGQADGSGSALAGLGGMRERRPPPYKNLPAGLGSELGGSGANSGVAL
jgi:hypothetical protein